MREIDSVKFNHGDIVYLKVNPDEAGMITGILFRPHSITYFITWGNANETTHYDVELTKEKAFIKKPGC